ncbi:uncharacterized protein C7orf26 homolog [Cynoglossus semilaevis]|uniref:Uncharacterized protein n=1 Tax=Cynoglossus semilaevis TaxID=244447 RepID=A0A3P8WUY3_CYNSE|nr:uncharacterized protein C7orf26 homolog [Cynoglossus semilaevis]
MRRFFHQDRDDATRQLIFSTLFNVDVKDQQAETRRRSLFGKLVSLSLVLDRTAVSECAATWLQGMDREFHLQLGQVLLDDYVPGLVSVLQNIRRASRRFCCQFITVVAARYDLSSEELTPPLELVHMFVSWIRDDPGLVLLTLRSTPLSSSQPISTLHVTPLEGLMCWCVKAPLVYRSTAGDGENEGNTDLLFSALHLSCLEIIQLLPNILAEKGVLGHVPLIQLGSMAALTSDLSKLLQRAENVASPDCGLSLERLAQGLQLARVCRVLLCCREELRAVCRRLPHNTLLQLVMTGPVMKDSGVDNTDSEAAGLTEGGVDPPLPPAGEEQVVSEGEPSVPGIADL